MSNATPQTVVSSIRAAGPAFATAFAKAPPSVRYKGNIYSRLSATTPEQKAWYLAAAAVSNPAAVRQMAPVQRVASFDAQEGPHFFLDADPAMLQEAKAELFEAQSKEQAIRLKLKEYQAQQKRWEGEKKKAEGSLFKDPGSVLSLGIANAAGSINAGLKVGWYQGEIEKLKLELADVRGQVALAQAKVRAAQEALDAENRRIRQEEERARQEQLRAQQAEAAARAAEQAQLQREAWAQQNAATNYAPNYGGPPMGGQDSGVWDPFNIYGGQDPYEFWIPDATTALSEDVMDLQPDPFGYLDARGEDYPGATRFRSAWCFDAYYEHTPERDMRAMFGADPMMSGPVHSTSSGMGGFDWVGAILAAILAIAPLILQALVGQGPPPSEIVPELASVTGADAYMNEKADRAGAAAKPDFTIPALILAVAIMAK